MDLIPCLFTLVYFCAMSRWFETWFNSPYYHILYEHRDPAEAETFVENLLHHLHPEKNVHFLDLACGAGRHARFIHKHGYKTTGADISPLNISLANAFKQKDLDFFVHDMRDPLGEAQYDYVLNLFTSFGYFEEESDQLKTIRAIYTGLKPGGMLILDFMNTPKILRELVPAETIIRGKVRFEIKRHVKNHIIYKEIRVIDGERTETFREEVQAISLEDFKQMFQEAGLFIENIFGSYQLESYDPEQSVRMILLARKK